MPIYQAWNPRAKAYVKYEFSKGGFKPLDVKQKLPDVPFKNIPIKGRKKR